MAARIVYAEDEYDIRDLIAFSLRFNGFEVLEARNGQEAVELVLAYKPDLVLLDVRMWLMTGYEAYEMLKSIDETKEL